MVDVFNLFHSNLFKPNDSYSTLTNPDQPHHLASFGVDRMELSLHPVSGAPPRPKSLVGACVVRWFEPYIYDLGRFESYVGCSEYESALVG